MLDFEDFIRVKQAAALLGVSPNTVRAWGADGKIPEYRHPVNNYRLYKRVDLERRVDLNTPRFLGKYIRDQVVEAAEVIYDAQR